MKGSKEILLEEQEVELSDKIKANAKLADTKTEVIIRPKRNIYQITEEMYTLMELLEEAGGEVTDENEQLAVMLSNVQLDFQAKAHNYGYVLLQQKAELDMVDKEIERLTKIKKAKENGNKRLKGVLLSCMNVLKIKKIQGENITLSVRDSSVVEITDAELVPKEYHADPKPTEPSKTKIKAALDEGIEVPGAQKSTNQSLQIK